MHSNPEQPRGINGGEHYEGGFDFGKQVSEAEVAASSAVWGTGIEILLRC
jgi:hypothetical protein